MGLYCCELTSSIWFTNVVGVKPLGNNIAIDTQAGEQHLSAIYTENIKVLAIQQVKYSENTEVNRYRFKGKRIIPIVGIPEHTMVLDEFSTGMDSNHWMGVDYANDTDILKIDRLQANSELFFFQMRMKMVVNIVRPAEIVVHTAYTKTA